MSKYKGKTGSKKQGQKQGQKINQSINVPIFISGRGATFISDDIFCVDRATRYNWTDTWRPVR